MEKCPTCKKYVWTQLSNHKCKPCWYCLRVDDYGNDIPVPDDFYSDGHETYASDREQAAIEYMQWCESMWADYHDYMDVFVLDEKENKIYKYLVETEIVRDYNISTEPEIFNVKA
jgi:hypothetical protein